MRSRTNIRYNNNTYSVEKIAYAITKEQKINVLYSYERWFKLFCNIKQPQNHKTYLWFCFVKFRGALKNALLLHFCKNSMPYLIETRYNKGFILRDKRTLCNQITTQRIKKGLSTNKLSSEIINGYSKAPLGKQEIKKLKNTKKKFFDVITDMYLGQAVRQKLPEVQIQKLLTGRVKNKV